MDITEVPVSQGSKSKKKNKRPKKKNVTEEVTGEDSGVEIKEEKVERSESAFPPSFSVSEIKNKQRRHLMFMKLKQEKRKVTIMSIRLTVSKRDSWSELPNDHADIIPVHFKC